MGAAPLIASSLRLPLDFDPALLQRDLQRILPEEWRHHYNASDYEGEWSGVALRSSDGSASHLYAGQDETSFLNTPLLERCDYFREVLNAFCIPMRSVRLLRLRAGSIIREHCDPALSFEDGEVRIHIPVETNPSLYFFLDGRRVILNEGEAWYLNLSRPHRLQNRGATDRVHLVIDGLVNDWVRELFSHAVPPRASAPETSEFDRFRELVLTDPALQDRLLATPDKSAFITLTLELGRDRGYSFFDDDVESAIRAGKRAWIERWIEA